MSSNTFLLGTANLGNKYGISNTDNFEPDIAISILNYAHSCGIEMFDTAPTYGIAERLIGQAIKPKENIKIFTKVPTKTTYTYEDVLASLNSSLHNLNQAQLHGLMFHDPEIHRKSGIREISKRLLDSGKVEKIGFSGYSLEPILASKAMYPEWSIFQVPENILDRRLYHSKELLEMSEAKNQFFVRSVFLQGLLLMRPDSLPSKFQPYRNLLENLSSIARIMSVNVLDLCLSYSARIPWSSGTIIAAASKYQLENILNYRDVDLDLDQLECLPVRVLDPRRW